MRTPRLLVVGAGAIGGLTAALMEERGLAVAVLGSNRPETLSLRDPGLLVERRGSAKLVQLDAFRRAEEIPGHFDFCLLAVKAAALEQVLTELVQRGDIDTFVSLGNGLVLDRVAALAGPERTIAGSVEWGASNLGNGRVRQTSENPVTLGELDGSIRERTRVLAHALEAASEVRITTNITGKLWSKLLLNSALSGLSVIGGCDCETALSAPDGSLALRQLWREGYQLALQQGVQLEPILGLHPGALASDHRSIWEPAVASLIEQSGPTKASMLQDIERGRPTEVDVINGAIVERSLQLGVRTPHNACVVELVHSFEHGERRPSTELFRQLSRAASAS